MRTIQEILDITIDFEYMVEALNADDDNAEFPPMCWALASAGAHQLITREEYELAVDAITNYMISLVDCDAAYLGRHLQAVGLPYSPLDRLAIYQDWANRPQAPV